MANASTSEDEAQSSQPPPAGAPPRPDPPKIPPPPSEHPPPYTPFGGQTAALLPQQPGQTTTGTNRNSRVVQPPGLRKYFQYLTKRNLIIAGTVLIALFVLILAFHWYNRMDKEAHRAARPRPLEGTRPLRVRELALGAFRSAGEKLVFDERTDSLFLSHYLPGSQVLKSGKLQPKQHLDGFQYSTHNMSERYYDCMRFTDNAICCSTSAHEGHHRTDCFLQQRGAVIQSVAVKYDFMPSWQSLADDKQLLLVYNHQRHAVLDLANKRLYKIEENRLPRGYVSVAFFFDMDTEGELAELVRSGEDFRICEYLKSSTGDYVLKEEECKTTFFAVEFELPKVQFCVNSLYTAVVQYGHLQGEEDLTWHLRVKYDSSPDVYSASKSFASEVEQLVIDCNDHELDIFVLGTHELYQFSAKMPNLRSEHFIQTRRF